MKVVILAKRAPQGRDLWLRPYGRFFYLSKILADREVEVHLVLLSYHKEEETSSYRDGIHWHFVNLLPNPSRYYRYARALTQRLGADWVIGFSDTYFGICAQRVARAAGSRALIDAYDNYESYLSWALPLHLMWRRALRHCNAVTAAGPGLLKLMAAEGEEQAATVIEMAADPQFTPGSKCHARESLGLPVDKLLVTYSGSLHKSRGVEELYSVMNRLQETRPDVGWVVSGRLAAGVELPANCIYLGYVDDSKVVDVLRSSDLILCANKPGAFGDYSYPVKIYEALSVGVPVVAFATESVEYVMRHNSDGLVSIGDIDATVAKVSRLLDEPYEVAPLAAGWDAQGEALHRFLEL